MTGYGIEDGARMKLTRAQRRILTEVAEGPKVYSGRYWGSIHNLFYREPPLIAYELKHPWDSSRDRIEVTITDAGREALR